MHWSVAGIELQNRLVNTTLSYCFKRNGDKPGNCLHRQSWKAHDSLLWTSDFGLAMFHNVANEWLRNSGSRNCHLFWFAYFSFVDACNRLLSKCLIKDQLPKIKTQLLQAFEKLERVAPSTLMTISVGDMHAGIVVCVEGNPSVCRCTQLFIYPT